MIVLMPRILPLLTGLLIATVGPALSQPADPHAGHHSGQQTAPSQPPDQQPPPSGVPVASGGTGGCMGMMCGAQPKKQLYPQLMELPAMTPQARQAIEADARERINRANAALVQAQSDYHRAMIGNDTAAMSEAATRQRTAVAEMISGTAALRALAEGQAPRQIALSWFREQMNLAPATVEAGDHAGPFGLSWYHIISMIAVGLLALALLAMGIARRQRSVALLNRLTAVPVSKPAVPAPPSPGPPAPPRAVPPPQPATPSKSWSGPLRIAAIVRETPHVKTFRLVEPNGGPIPFTFAPGQFVTLTAEVDGHIVRRSYTIASPPTRSSYVEVTVKREDDGEFSRFLHDKASVGQAIEVRGPVGAFVFDGGNADSIVLIAGGVGITPMMCVIRYLTDMSWPGEIFLVYAARSTDELIFREELEYLQRRYRRLHAVVTVDARSEGTAWMGLEGPIDKQALSHAVPGIDKRRVHLCGPPPMMAAIRRMLSELGVPEAQIKTEAFGPATGLVPPPPTASPPLPPPSVARVIDQIEQSTAVPDAVVPAVGPAAATLSFARSHKSAALPPDKTVLEVAESIGVPIDYSCRVGTCGLCKTKLLAGNVTMEVQDALTPEDKAAGLILACQARSLGDVAVDA
jgi:ferredoxin-NADP reductase